MPTSYVLNSKHLSYLFLIMGAVLYFMYTLIMVAVTQIPDPSLPITDAEAQLIIAERTNKLIFNAFMVIGLTGLFILSINWYIKKNPKKPQIKDYSI